MESHEESFPELETNNEQYSQQGSMDISGHRIVNIKHLFAVLKQLKHPGFGCSFFDIDIVSEKRYGLRSVFSTKCSVCGLKSSFSTESSLDADINKSAVSGTIAIGAGFSQLRELCSALDIPSLTFKTYAAKEVSIQQLLYSNSSISSKSLQYGQCNEMHAREIFEEEFSMSVVSCGLFVHEEYSFLGASPDGLIDEDSIIEIKCPFLARDLTVEEAVKSKIIKFCYIDTENKIRLKPNDSYMYQIQGQLEITDRKYCYFFVYKRKDYHCKLILRDSDFWQSKMIEKLQKFYYSAFLPEYLDSRVERELPLRDIQIEDL
jgi:hypothetical protein